MAQRKSDYERRDNDLYETPPEVADWLCEVISVIGSRIWEPAIGTGKLARALSSKGASVVGSDVIDYGSTFQCGVHDFTVGDEFPGASDCSMLITNPPFGPRGRTAEQFIEQGLSWVRRRRGTMALLLPVDFDSAKTRHQFFGDCTDFVGKIVLTKRIRWFENETGASPSANHCWCVWRSDHVRRIGPPSIWYAPRRAA